MNIEIKTIHSNKLNKNMKVSIYVPENYSDVKLPVLYFMHGRTGNETLLEQLHMDEIEEEMIKENRIKPMIIVCPNMDNSRGINSSKDYKEVKGKYGIVNKGLYEDYFIEELIPYIDNNYNTINDRSGRFVGGISAGGYIALHNGLRHQDMFSKIGGHMPAMDLSYKDEDECYFTNEEMWNKYDPLTIAKENNIKDIKIYLDDGDEDEGKFYIACEKLYNILKTNDVEVENHLNKGHHNGEYIVNNLKKYFDFYNK